MGREADFTCRMGRDACAVVGALCFLITVVAVSMAGRTDQIPNFQEKTLTYKAVRDANTLTAQKAPIPNSIIKKWPKKEPEKEEDPEPKKEKEVAPSPAKPPPKGKKDNAKYAPKGAGVCRDADDKWPSWSWAGTTEESGKDACDSEPNCSGFGATQSGVYQIYCKTSEPQGDCHIAGNGGGPVTRGNEEETELPCMVLKT